MLKIFLDVVGCRLNQSEMESIAAVFRALGHEIVAEPHEADLAIVNTCTVTVKAAADSRKKLRKAAREGAPRVIATGCWATRNPDAARRLAGVTDVVVNNKKEQIPASILDLSLEELRTLTLVREPLPGARARTRAFIKVQEGCDNICTYCLTRLARGRSRSRPWEDISRDIQAALIGNAKEVVLTGVQLGAWGRDLPTQDDLGSLIARVLSMQTIGRVRLSSLEPWDFEKDWLRLWQDERLCRHLHIPLQSGSDSILKAMKRPITTAAYADLVATIRSAVPGIAVTTDVIAGFPGETEADFIETKAFIQRMGFAGGHVFTYSPRPGTAAAYLTPIVESDVAKSRNAELRQIFKTLAASFRAQFIDSATSVLWEWTRQVSPHHWTLSGLTDHYIKVFAQSNVDRHNEITPLHLVGEHPRQEALIGKLLVE